MVELGLIQLYLYNEIPSYFFDSDLFVFSNSGRKSVINISNWFITAKPHNVIIDSVKELLTKYWEKENCAIHYFICHLFFRIACDFYNDEWEKVYKFSNVQPHLLASQLSSTYSEDREKQIFSACPLQKLSNKIKKPINIYNTFYEKYYL